MRTRVWGAVGVAALTILAASSTRLVTGVLGELVGALSWSIVGLGVIAWLLLFKSLSTVRRTWVVRRIVAGMLARLGAPDPVIARSAQIPQDGVAYLRAVSGGKSSLIRQEDISGIGTRFTRSRS